MSEPHRESTEDPFVTWMQLILDRSQPIWQAGATVILLDTHLQRQRQRATQGHHWCCLCLRQN